MVAAFKQFWCALGGESHTHCHNSALFSPLIVFSVLVSPLYFQRVDKSGAAGEVLKEAQSINKSLSALGDIISALTTNQNHVPYRNHPLTMLMSDSIGGNAKTLMFVNTSPADYNTPESNSSLAFASRCKDITNAVAAGPGVQAAQVSALKKELAKLNQIDIASYTAVLLYFVSHQKVQLLFRPTIENQL